MNLQLAKRWQSAPVFRVHDLVVIEGVNVGQTIFSAADLCLDDVYCIAADGRSHRLSAFQGPGGRLIVSEATLLGAPGSDLRFDSRLTFISETGIGVEVNLIVETDGSGQTSDIYFQPEHPLDPKQKYQLIRVEPNTSGEPTLSAHDFQTSDGLAPVRVARQSAGPAQDADMQFVPHQK